MGYVVILLILTVRMTAMKMTKMMRDHPRRESKNSKYDILLMTFLNFKRPCVHKA